MSTPSSHTLQAIPELNTVPLNQLQWLVDQCEVVTLAPGDYLFKPGDPIDKMYILLEGSFALKSKQNDQFRLIDTIKKNTITGYLPYSRAKEASGYAEANETSCIMVLHRPHFKTMIHEHEELTTALVHIMSSRIRHFTKRQQQNDKMMALGKLSAGLAHELNNPSAAVVRSAQSLKKHLSFLPENFKSVIKIRTEDETIDAVNKIVFDKAKNGMVLLPLMERSAKEDELAEWLEENGFDDGYEIVDNFVDFGFNVEDFEYVKESLRDEDLVPVINWLYQVLTTEKLVNEIEDASQRINDLVRSVKSYTHMDQAPEKKPTDIHTGINNTLTMLKHKINKGNIEVIPEFGQVPEVAVFVSEINQVWTNLIDNAIDAMESSKDKKLTLQTLRDGKFVLVNIIDSGKGISAEEIDKIFDPFFTTKPIGKGTGLGLDVVHQIVGQHNGSVKVISEPGRTEFQVCLPIQ
ncbi:cyclic nucleotide-binding domain-containing protein [Fulvivirga sp. M361]|uniref:ATP-binding protein n=1 Tax=Fulvivirga sp. M361 TaxID=2594266 RepID=UPI001179908B|nr:ATP-binding protein [Fulvivirga sp. M361]TRX62649.1 cyclic nucleotide-binding domain-containing protein [Fulvivirga sp. M361]